MEQSKKLLSIGVDKLIAHPGNPNRMSEAMFKKLLGHIRRTGNYEPIIVRRHPSQEGCFEIINGHHRKKALEEMGNDRADCIVWEVDDEEAMILLATLNRLAGGDDIHRKSELIRKLSVKFSSKYLSKLLPDSRKSIEHLNELFEKQKTLRLEDKPMLNATVFFLTDEQKQIVDAAIKEAVDPGAKGTRPQKRAWAIVEILRQARRR
jgi:hypothetical protein